MQEWIISVVASYGYLGIFLMIALENIFPPIPSEVILTFGGFMTVATSMNIFGVVTAATAGSVAGGLVLYMVGRWLGKARIHLLIERRGRFLRIQGQDVERATAWFERSQGKAVFIGRMVPLVRSLISIPAGIAHMPPGKFVWLTAMGAAVWNTVLVCTGAYLGERWEQILSFLGLYSTATLAVLIIAAVIAGGYLLLRGRTA